MISDNVTIVGFTVQKSGRLVNGGNSWSNCTCVDMDHDGIGDSPLEIDGDNIDACPLMGIVSSFNTSSGYPASFMLSEDAVVAVLVNQFFQCLKTIKNDA